MVADIIHIFVSINALLWHKHTDTFPFLEIFVNTDTAIDFYAGVTCMACQYSEIHILWTRLPVYIDYLKSDVGIYLRIDDHLGVHSDI